MKIALAEIEKCLRILVGLARVKGVEFLDTGDDDYYWTVGTDEWLDFQKEPQIVVGSLEDDIFELRKLLESEEPFPTSVDVERLSAVLKLLAHRISA